MKRSVLFIVSILCVALVASCDYDPENIYGRWKEMHVLDEYGEDATVVRASIVSGTRIVIIGGVGNNHIVEVEDESILSAEYETRGAVMPFETIPAAVRLKPKQYGSTTVTITDTDIDKTFHIQVDVVDEYSSLTVLTSTCDDIQTDMILALRNGEDNDYRLLMKNGKDYECLESGEYHFETFDSALDEVWLTLKSGDKEIVWKILDADNNKDGHIEYVSDVITGLGLSETVMTKLSYTTYYPTLFLFVDTFNPDRTFLTGSAGTIKYMF